MPDIPNTINEVSIEFGSTVNKSVDERIIEALKLVVKSNVAADKCLTKIYISSAHDQHELPSRHAQGEGKAVDISRINDMKMATFYPSDPTVKAVVDAMQAKFEEYVHRRENFGPSMKKKLGNDHAVPGHSDHIHFSIN